MIPFEITAGPAHHPLLLAGCAVLVLLFLGSRRLLTTRLRAALAPRLPGHFEDSFVHRLAAQGLSPRVARSTYRYLQQRQKNWSPILPDDTLRRDLGLDRSSVLETARALLRLNERYVSANYLYADLTTVADLVRLVQTAERRDLDRAA